MNKITTTILSLALLGFGAAAGAVQAKDIKDTVVSVSLGTEPVTMDPHAASSALTTTMHRWVFDTLMHREKGKAIPVPHAAESATFVNPTTVEFKMREGVKFSNGEDVDAEAVRFSLLRPRQKDFKTVQAKVLRVIESVEVVSKWVARVHLNAPDPGFLNRLSDWGNLVPPKHYASISQEEAAINPVGSGPYRMLRWKKDVEMIFEANPDYWMADAPKIKTIRYLPIREAGTKVAALLKGEVDIINQVPAQYIPKIEESDKADIKIVRGTRIFHLGFSHGITSPLQDVRVRKAIAHAINRDVIVKAVVEGRGAVANEPLHEWTEGNDDDRQWPYAYDPAQSRKLLAEAGYPDGFKINFYAPAGRYTKDKEVTEAIAGFLRQAGIDVQYQALTWKKFVGAFRARTNADAEPFLYYIGYGNGGGDTDRALSAIASCKGAWSGYCNPEVDQMLDEASSIIDLDKRRDLFQDITRRMADDLSHVMIWQEDAVWGLSKTAYWDVRNDDRLYAWTVESR